MNSIILFRIGGATPQSVPVVVIADVLRKSLALSRKPPKRENGTAGGGRKLGGGPIGARRERPPGGCQIREHGAIIRAGRRGLVLYTLYCSDEVGLEQESSADLSLV